MNSLPFDSRDLLDPGANWCPDCGLPRNHPECRCDEFFIVEVVNASGNRSFEGAYATFEIAKAQTSENWGIPNSLWRENSDGSVYANTPHGVLVISKGTTE